MFLCNRVHTTAPLWTALGAAPYFSMWLQDCQCFRRMGAEQWALWYSILFWSWSQFIAHSNRLL